MEFHHHAIAVSDLERAESFYLGLLRLPLIQRHHDQDGRHRATWLECAPGFLALERAEGMPSNPGSDLRHHCFVFGVPSEKRGSIIEGLQQAGYPIEKQTDFTFYVRDPDGALVGFSHYPEPAARS